MESDHTFSEAKQLYFEKYGDARDHNGLYDGGPLHDLLRQALDNVMRFPSTHTDQDDPSIMSDEEALEQVIGRLTAGGHKLYECDITPPMVRPYRISVVRAFVPGLIPMYFGYDRIRFGCRRIWSREAPGRLCNLLPHFMT